MKNKMLRLTVILIGSMLAFGCNSWTPEQREMAKGRVQETYNDFNKLHSLCNEYVNDSTKLILCNAEDDPNVDPKSIGFIHFSQLKRFAAKSQDEWDNAMDDWEDSDWHWLSTERQLAKYFGEYDLKNCTDMQLHDAVYTVEKPSWGSIFYDKQIAIIYPDPDSKIIMPELLDDDAFDSGYFKGWIIIVDAKTYELACITPFEVLSSTILEYKDYSGRRASLFDEDPAKVLRNDFKDNMKSAISAVLPGYPVREYGGF